ncbi:LysR family transcriptional regulator [Phaeobacter italicus]|uniref:LysR family transcriptional regulator n=1 Tax=Phaeobacter italicus TaxID=481446 RepID=UPI000186FF15|nr:LysR family transcriptional regulator [Phaeobacter italicus]EEB69370.1 transcriptional regulator, LysR family [Ruegeria sp. R11]CRL16608.1 Gcv operon activator [Phaeobacter italicus]SFH29117.1 transcriptional regulator, LysR family [Phaeobacter italicus]
MSKSLPPLTWFRSFEAAARTLSFTAAAEEIGLTQSAVSQQVKSLEMRLGVDLFVRRTRGLALTDAGRKLLPEVGSALEMLSGAAARFDIGAAGDLLTVATSVSIAQWVIAPNLAAFKTQNPEIRLRILSAIWPDDFHASRADVQIRFGSEKQVGAGSQRLLPDHLIAVKSPNLETDFGSCPLIETVGTSNGWATWGEANGPVQEPTVFADTYGMALQLAVHGNGVALVSELVAKHAVTSGLVVQAHPGQIESKEGYFLSINEELPAACVFRDWLRTQLAAG